MDELDELADGWILLEMWNVLKFIKEPLLSNGLIDLQMVTD